MRYVRIEGNVVTNATNFDGEKPVDWNEDQTWIASETAQIGWAYADGTLSAPPPPVVSLGDQKDAKLSALSDRRYRAETGGMTFMGMQVKTDRETSGVLTSAVVKTILDPNYSVPNWKMADGSFVTLSAEMIVGIAQAVAAHVQATFDNEAMLAADIAAAGDQAALDAVDIEAGWP